MTLEDFVNEINEVDEELIIFQKGELNINSEVALFNEETAAVGATTVIINDDEYFYLLEVCIAQEFVTDWIKSLPVKPSAEEIAPRLFQYAINDA